MSERPLEGLRILVVEDMADMALSLSEGLRRAGAITVEIKASGRQVRRRLMQPPAPDLVVLDQNIVGEETGMDIAYWMREQEELRHTLRVSYTGTYPELIEARNAEDPVFHAIITKPLPLPMLVEKLAAVVVSAPVVRD